MKKIKLITFMILLVTAAITIFATGYKQDRNMTLRVAFPYDKPMSIYEPTKIHFAPEYILLENIYSPLIELHPVNGEPVPGIASRYEWINDELHLHIREDLKTSTGIIITAQDAEFSLKRVLIKSGNTHGNFRDLMCAKMDIKTVDEKCEGIRVEGNTLILTPNEKKEFLLPMLAALDFAIIPKGSVDPVSLDIIDYKNTSGPYYLESEDGKGNIVLTANKSHYHYAKNIPQTIVLVPSGIEGYENSIEQFEKGKIDYITTIDKLPAEKIIKFGKSVQGNLHRTINIRTFVLTFTEKGLSKFSVKERLKIGKVFKVVWEKYHQNDESFDPTDQFFIPFGAGGLKGKKEDELKALFEGLESKTNKKLDISTVRIGKIEGFKELLSKSAPNINLFVGNNIPSFVKDLKVEDMPDAFISGPDTGFLEDIGLISYSINAGYFGAEKDSMRSWLNEYMKIQESEVRVQKLKNLHSKVLTEGILIPLINSPYAAFARKGWKINISQIYANNPLWPIIKE